MATEDEFDIVVIGGGPGGYATALYGAAAGLSVAIVERDKVGGHLPAPWLHPGQGIPRDGGRLPTVARPGSSASTSRSPRSTSR